MTEFLFIRIIDLILKLTFQVILWMNPQMSTFRIFHNYKSYKSTSKQSSWAEAFNNSEELEMKEWYFEPLLP